MHTANVWMCEVGEKLFSPNFLCPIQAWACGVFLNKKIKAGWFQIWIIKDL